MPIRRSPPSSRRGEHLVDAAAHVERLLGQLVQLAFHDHLERFTVSSSFTYLPGVPVNASATKNGCDRKR